MQKPTTCSLVLHKKWFNMIACGKKKEEYRHITPYFISRLFVFPKSPIRFVHNEWKQGKPVRFLRLFDGYARERRWVVVKVIDITAGVGRKEWGATDHSFIIKLGDIVSSNFTHCDRDEE